MKIFKEYEASRGEENEILNGCLYELRNKFKGLMKEDSTES